MVDTNSNPKTVDFPIPANDDATKSIAIILESITGAIKEGLEDRKTLKDKGADEEVKAESKKVEEVASEETKED